MGDTRNISSLSETSSQQQSPPCNVHLNPLKILFKKQILILSRLFILCWSVLYYFRSTAQWFSNAYNVSFFKFFSGGTPVTLKISSWCHCCWSTDHILRSKDWRAERNSFGLEPKVKNKWGQGPRKSRKANGKSNIVTGSLTLSCSEQLVSYRFLPYEKS